MTYLYEADDITDEERLEYLQRQAVLLSTATALLPEDDAEVAEGLQAIFAHPSWDQETALQVIAHAGVLLAAVDGEPAIIQHLATLVAERTEEVASRAAEWMPHLRIVEDSDA